MKYLKKFNEDNEHEFRKELKEFCDNYLIYLKEMGFDIKVSWSNFSDYPDSQCIYISLPNEHDNSSYFKYADIKDYFIPFINLLNDEFKISADIEFYCGYRKRNFLRKHVFKFLDPTQEFIYLPVNKIISDKNKLNVLKNITILVDSKK